MHSLNQPSLLAVIWDTFHINGTFAERNKLVYPNSFVFPDPAGPACIAVNRTLSRMSHAAPVARDAFIAEVTRDIESLFFLFSCTGRAIVDCVQCHCQYSDNDQDKKCSFFPDGVLHGLL